MASIWIIFLPFEHIASSKGGSNSSNRNYIFTIILLIAYTILLMFNINLLMFKTNLLVSLTNLLFSDIDFARSVSIEK